MSQPILLICTVGGSPEPIVATLKKWKPARVRFVHTPATKAKVDDIVAKARVEGVDIDRGRYDPLELPNEQDFQSCLEHLRELTEEVRKWAAGGSQVVVDITGGTKCMTAAIAIQAIRWPSCLFSYVGGKERTKDGVGVVVSGSEVILHSQNPWNALGHQAVVDYGVLFDQHAYLAAANVVAVAKSNVSDAARKRELSSLEQLAKALAEWDCFNHTTSRSLLLVDVSKSANDLRAALGPTIGNRVLNGINQLVSHLNQLTDARPPSLYHVHDLLANAKRRSVEGRFDDAVARLYRAIEAIAQVALSENWGIESTEKVPLEKVPETLRNTWAPRAIDGVLKLGLQDAYELLAALGDPVGAKFRDAKLGGPESPLVARNRSILAHGFELVSDKVFNKLWGLALSLADVGDENNLPSFPKLSEGKS